MIKICISYYAVYMTEYGYNITFDRDIFHFKLSHFMSTLNTFYFKVLLLNVNTFFLSSSVLSKWVDIQEQFQ